MNISTSMGIGLAKKLAPNFEYTWAFDASKQDDLSVIFGHGNFNSTLVDDGININFSGALTSFLSFQDADFTTGSVSSGTNVPDGAISGTKSGNIGHPGRYWSTVVTLHELTVVDGTLSSELFGSLITRNVGGTIANISTNGSDPSHINGNPRALEVADADSSELDMTQSEIDSFIGRPVAVTYDMSLAAYSGDGDGDPTTLIIYPAYNENVTMNATIHGFIFSNVPPIIHHLPVEIDNPTL